MDNHYLGLATVAPSMNLIVLYMMCPAFRLVRNLECGWTTLDHRSKPAISCLRNMWTETIAVTPVWVELAQKV